MDKDFEPAYLATKITPQKGPDSTLNGSLRPDDGLALVIPPVKIGCDHFYQLYYSPAESISADFDRQPTK